MSHTWMLAFLMIWILMAAGGLAFLGWCLWTLFWMTYDHFMERWKRIHNSRIDANYRRGQFSVPYAQKDFK